MTKTLFGHYDGLSNSSMSAEITPQTIVTANQGSKSGPDIDAHRVQTAEI